MKIVPCVLLFLVLRGIAWFDLSVAEFSVTWIRSVDKVKMGEDLLRFFFFFNSEGTVSVLCFFGFVNFMWLLLLWQVLFFLFFFCTWIFDPVDAIVKSFSIN